MIGAILGDIIGSPYEFDRGNKSKEFPLFSRESIYTDDTVMTLAVSLTFLDAQPSASDDWILQNLANRMRQFGKMYPNAGYGGMFRQWLRNPECKAYNSFGKKTLYHYISMAEGNYREYLQGEIVRVKKYFYVLRPVLACQWILDRGTPPPMLFSELIKEELPVELINPVNQLLELKMNSSEVKLIKRITEINEYLDTSIPSIKSAVRLLDDSHTPEWNELNQLFLRELMK